MIAVLRPSGFPVELKVAALASILHPRQFLPSLAAMGDVVEVEGKAEAGGDSRARACEPTWTPGAPRQAELAVAAEASLVAALRAEPAIVGEIVAVIRGGLKATKCHYDALEKKMVYEADWKERREMAKFAAAYLEGLPVQTVVGVGGSGSSVPRLAEALHRSPGARRALQGYLARSGLVLDLSPASASAGDRESPSESGASASS